MRVKTVAEAWKDAGGDTAAFWGGSGGDLDRDVY